MVKFAAQPFWVFNFIYIKLILSSITQTLKLQLVKNSEERPTLSSASELNVEAGMSTEQDEMVLMEAVNVVTQLAVIKTKF